MGPKEAAVAVELLGVKRIVPCHYGTFGLLTGTREEFEKLVPSGTTVEQLEPGESVTV
jgi:L-ascorbate metabolism protein UlaG (beta-lactamase superfamily)